MIDLPVQLVIEPEPRRGSWNMAADECLLEAASAEGVRAVRLYQWSEPTVSLGYFQDEREFRGECRFSDLAAVRRLSGGGAILHHLELTYSLVLPPGDPLVADPTRLYSLVHAAILDVLRTAGVEAAMRGRTGSWRRNRFCVLSAATGMTSCSRGIRLSGVLSGAGVELCCSMAACCSTRRRMPRSCRASMICRTPNE